ncbi:MAG: PDZ/DHR/GLGF domain-containing protein [bacterium]|nr:MAG: PDZ/DHR/GLGF domain-containing protein [bacterium]
MSTFPLRRWLTAGCLAAAVAIATAVVTAAKDHGGSSGYVIISGDDGDATSQGYLGVSVERLRNRLREAFDIPSDVSGLIITDVHDDTPADEAGLRTQDVILRVNSQPVDDEDDFTDLVRSFKPDTRLAISIWRDGDTKDVSVTLGRRQRMRVESWGGGPAPQPPTPPSAPGMHLFSHPGVMDLHELTQLGGRGRLGIEIQDLNADIAPYFGVENSKGALVWRVREESPADLAGLKAGDVIVEIEGKAIDSTSELREAMADQEDGDSVAITWLRRGQSQSASVTLEQGDMPGTYMFSDRPGRRVARSTPTPGAGRSIDRIEREMEALQRQMEALRRDMDRLKD